MDKKIRVGIIGFGNMGSGHAKNMSEGKVPDMLLAAVADVKPERREIVQKEYPDAAVFSDAEEMIASGLVDACIIAVPHYYHPVYAISCMKHGVHVMCEKPAGVYTRQVREMNEESARHPDVVFGMMFNQRTNPMYRKIYELVHGGKYGQLRRVNWIITTWYRSQAYYDSGDWRATWAGEGGGVLLNQAPHQLDLLQWICGLPVKVDTHMHFGKWHKIEVEDDVSTYLEFANGATGVFITTTGDTCGTNRLEIQLEGAKLIAENDCLKVMEFEHTEQEWNAINKNPFAAMPSHPVEVELEVQTPNQIQHCGVLNAWAGAILRGTPLVASGVEGINGLTLSNAMHLSAFLGKPVDIPFDEELYYTELMKRVKNSHTKTSTVSVVSDTRGTY